MPTLDLGLPGWTLRAWRGSDAPSLAEHANKVAVWRWMSDGFPHLYTREIAEHWVRQGHIEFGGDHWAIAFEDQAVGGCGIVPQHGPLRCSAEVGWWLGQAYWGRGVGSRAARALIERAFENPQIERVFAPIHAGNQRSMGVARRAGMTFEAVQRKSALKDGRVVDRHLFVALRPD